jgi:hypothetical protein
LDPLPALEDDGLYTPEVGDWAERKYLLISYYAEMFSTSMKDKWGQRVYIDPFAGAGRGRIKGTSCVIPTSALLALEIRNPFDRYIFCDSSPECIGALRERALRSHPVDRAALSQSRVLPGPHSLVHGRTPEGKALFGSRQHGGRRSGTTGAEGSRGPRPAEGLSH